MWLLLSSWIHSWWGLFWAPELTVSKTFIHGTLPEMETCLMTPRWLINSCKAEGGFSRSLGVKLTHMTRKMQSIFQSGHVILNSYHQNLKKKLFYMAVNICYCQFLVSSYFYLNKYAVSLHRFLLIFKQKWAHNASLPSFVSRFSDFIVSFDIFFFLELTCKNLISI